MRSSRQFSCRVGVSLIIHNRLDELESTLEDLSEQIDTVDQVCMVDNASEDKKRLTQLKKRFKGFHWIQNTENIGYGAGHHQAVSWLQEQDCQYMLLLNPDLGFPPNAIDRLIKASESCNDLWVLGPLLVQSDDEDPLIDSAGLELDSCFRAMDRYQGKHLSETPFIQSNGIQPELVSSICGAVLWIPSQLLPLRPEALIFSTDYFAYFEDMELGLELAKRGVRMGLVRDLLFVHHRGGFGRLEEIKESDWQNRKIVLKNAILNRYRTFFRHEGLMKGLIKRPRLLPYELGRWLYLLIQKPFLRYLFLEVVQIWREELCRRANPPVRKPS